MSTPLPVLPAIMVEAGLVTGTPVQVPTSLVLDDAVLGLLDTGTLGAGTTWSAIPPALILGFTITRPSTRLQGPLFNYQAGTVSILADNSDGSLDPDNLAGPYVTGGVTQLVPMVPVRVRASIFGTVYQLYSGFADGWLPAQVTYEGGYAELTIGGTDAFKVLAGITLAAVAVEGVGADTGARVRDILLRAGWYTSAERLLISTGNSVLQGTTLGADALSLMQIAVDSEIGQLYVNGAGAVVFRARRDLVTDTRSNTVQAVFGDLPGTAQPAGTELAYAAVGRANDDTTIANDIQATRVSGTLQEVKDAPSIAKYLFPRTYARTDLILQNDSDALAWAQWVLSVSRGAEDRIETLTVDPAADPANLWPQVLGREIGDRIQVWHRPASVATPITKDCFIAGITHAWDSVASSWLTTWTLMDASKYGSFLTLDNPTLGQLDSNALTFLGDWMAAPVWVPGQVLASADVNSWFVGQYAYKTGDTNRTSTALTADPDLTVAVAASARYMVDATLYYKSTANTNTFQWSWATPAGAGGLYQGIYVGSGGGSVIDSHLWSDSGIQGGIAVASTIYSIAIRGTLVVAGTAGNLTFNWAETTSSAPTITLTNHSRLVLIRIG